MQLSLTFVYVLLVVGNKLNIRAGTVSLLSFWGSFMAEIKIEDLYSKGGVPLQKSSSKECK